MTSAPPHTPEQAVWLSPAWRQVSDRLLSGIYHELNGRASAIFGIVQSAGFDDGGIGKEELELLTTEASRLLETVGLLRWLRHEGWVEPESIRLPDLLEPVVTLHRHHSGLEGVEVEVTGDADVPPVTVHRSTLAEILLVLLGFAAREVQVAGLGRVVVRYEALDGQCVLRIDTEEKGRHGVCVETAREPLALSVGEVCAAVREALRGMGGELRTGAGATDDTPPPFELRLPALTTAPAKPTRVPDRTD